MSYRAFKKLVGETSLERKCRFLMGTGSLILISASFWLYAKQTDQIAYKTVTTSGRLLIGPTLYSLHDEKLEGREALDQFQKSTEERWPKGLNKYTYRVIKPNAKKQTNQADPDEPGLIAQFVSDPVKTEETRFPANGESVFYYGAIRSVPLCAKCHPRNADEREEYGEKLADDTLMAVVRIKLSSASFEEQIHTNRAILISAALVTSILIMIGSYLVVRYVIVKPVKHLKEVSDAIAGGNLNVRSEIQTGDEFEDLSYAFNRMLRSLMQMQEQLKGVNVNLDKKVDELARTNMALYESNRLKSDFLATMSHELRTPLNSILGFSELMLNKEQLPDKQKRWAGNIQTSGKQLLNLINDLLDLAKIEAGKMDVKPEPLDVAELADILLTMFRPLAEKKNIDLRSSLPLDFPLIEQDAGKLRQILSNLMSNAIKFTPEGGRVQLTIEPDGNELVMTVTDTGVGIAADDQEHIFEKFRQAANPLTRDHDGTGLGLSIVRELAKLLGGEVTLKSELGRGSTFEVRVPRKLIPPPKSGYILGSGALVDGPDAPVVVLGAK